MPLRLLKQLVKRYLEQHGRHLVYSPLTEITGLDLTVDLRFMIRNDKPIIFDVGANIGQSIDLFQGIFSSANIFAFEPSFECFSQLTKNYQHTQVQLYNIALGASESESSLHEYDMSVLNSFLPLDANRANRFRDRSPTRVQRTIIRPLDAIHAETGFPHIDLLKIDTQGFDLKVLQGAEKALAAKAISSILVELNFSPMYDGQARATELIDYLKERRFALVDFYEKYRQEHSLAWCTALFTLLK
jgi:FkbM family methyltransferase